MQTDINSDRIRQQLEEYVSGKPFRLNPDTSVVDRVVQGLAKRQETTGMATCPCRMATGKPEADKNIVCPCIYHEQEITEKGACHCLLFVADETEGHT